MSEIVANTPSDRVTVTMTTTTTTTATMSAPPTALALSDAASANLARDADPILPAYEDVAGDTPPRYSPSLRMDVVRRYMRSLGDPYMFMERGDLDELVVDFMAARGISHEGPIQYQPYRGAIQRRPRVQVIEADDPWEGDCDCRICIPLEFAASALVSLAKLIKKGIVKTASCVLVNEP